MGNNDFEQRICSAHPDMNYSEGVGVISQSVEQKWLPYVED